MAFFGWMYPLMPILGGLAVLSPIIIHLLNKRRFKIVHWAAMDFLFEADKKNRRRVQLENFLLLLLRCLAMLLLGLILARPFFSSAMASIFSSEQKFEHYLLLDDSLSQRVQSGNQSGLQRGLEAVKQLLQESSVNDRDDWITLVLTSQPDRPVFENASITVDTVDSLLERVDEIEVSDSVADYDQALAGLETMLQSQQSNVNRVAYVISDLRQRDWLRDTENENNPNRVVQRISEMESVNSAMVVDVGAALEENLAVTGIQVQDKLVANKTVQFDVTVANLGRQDADGVQVTLRVDEYPLPPQRIDRIGRGESVQVTFVHRFASDETDLLEPTSAERAGQLKNYSVVAEISSEGSVQDVLQEDSSRFYAARVLNGISVLFVDGDPSAVSERGDVHYLNSLKIEGSGLTGESITVSELETISLSQYRVIFLCNIDEAGEERLQALREWVQAGGALVLMPGNQVRARVFNKSFTEDVDLSPLRLTEILGDSSQRDSMEFVIKDTAHPALKLIVDFELMSFFQKTDIFSWWGSELVRQPEELPADEVGGEGVVVGDAEAGSQSVAAGQPGAGLANVVLTISDERDSPAMVQRQIGKGSVVTFTIGADGDWNQWPGEVTYALTMLPLIESLIGNFGSDSQVQIGGRLGYQVDLSKYGPNVTLIDPASDKLMERAEGQTADDKGILQRVDFEQTQRRGIYRMALERRVDQAVDEVYFAVNVDPDEGNLKRLDLMQQGDFLAARSSWSVRASWEKCLSMPIMMSSGGNCWWCWRVFWGSSNFWVGGSVASVRTLSPTETVHGLAVDKLLVFGAFTG